MFIAAADLHLRDKTPKYRCDDFKTNQFLKFEQLLHETVTRTTTNILVLAGDIFDSKGVNYATVVRAMGLIMSYNVTILLVPGQHDLRYHRHGLDGTPLGVLLQLSNVHLLNPTEPYEDEHELTFLGAGWNEEPETSADVLVTHRMVTESGPLWPDQTDYITGKALLKKYKDFSCIISGDNHRPHKVNLKNQTQLNCGSMCRTGKDQYGYKPAFWHFHPEKDNVVKIPYKIQPASEVFDSEKIVRDEKFEENREKFQTLTENITTKTPKPDFERILLHVMKEAETSSEAQNLITTKMEELNGS